MKTFLAVLFASILVCTLSANAYAEECGDGILDPGEYCDDGNSVDCDGCSSWCYVETDNDGDLVYTYCDCDDDPSDDPVICDACECGTDECAPCARCIYPGAIEIPGDGIDSDCYQPDYDAVANSIAGSYGSRSLVGSGIFNQLALLLIPTGAVIFLRILRRKN